MRVGERVVVYAMPAMLTVPLQPREARGRADEDGCKTKCNHGSAIADDHTPHETAEALVRKDL